MPLPILGAIGAGIGAIGAIGKFFTGRKQMREAKKINPIWQQYQTSPYAKQRLGIAQQLFGGRMAGAPELEKNLFSSQANTIDSVNRNATDSSQALALAAGAQGQTNQSLSDLQTKEAQNKYAMLNNLNQGYEGLVSEGDKEYQSLLQKYQMDTARKSELMNAGQQNKFGAFSDLSSLGIMGGQYFGGDKSFTPKSSNAASFLNPVEGGNSANYTTPGDLSGRMRPMSLSLQKPSILDSRFIGQPPNWRYPG